jgi:class 3 adenylate cyclase
MDVPDPQYARAEDGAYIAYQVVGDGPVDIAWLFDFTGNIDLQWERTIVSAWFEGLAAFSRLILHDRRGTGLSSRDRGVPNLETRADDIALVLDTVESKRPLVGAMFEGLAPAVLLAARDPDRLGGLLWWDPAPRTTWARDYPWGSTDEDIRHERRQYADWGTPAWAERWADGLEKELHTRPTDAEIGQMVRVSRGTCTPDQAIMLAEMWWQTDVRPILPLVQTPTLLLVEEDEGPTSEVAAHVASLMQRAEVAIISAGEWPRTRHEAEQHHRPFTDAVRRFAGIEAEPVSSDTVLATVLFTDIVGSTERQAALGDRGWKTLVEQHHAVVRDMLGKWRGIEQDTAGDGFYATFDGPARAIHCAVAVTDDLRRLGIEIRAGIHTGECVISDGKCAGIAVSIGARIAALAAPSQVLVSQTVKDLVAGSGIQFQQVGERELKGIPERWRLYSATW